MNRFDRIITCIRVIAMAVVLVILIAAGMAESGKTSVSENKVEEETEKGDMPDASLINNTCKPDATVKAGNIRLQGYEKDIKLYEGTYVKPLNKGKESHNVDTENGQDTKNDKASVKPVSVPTTNSHQSIKNSKTGE